MRVAHCKFLVILFHFIAVRGWEKAGPIVSAFASLQEPTIRQVAGPRVGKLTYHYDNASMSASEEISFYGD